MGAKIKCLKCGDIIQSYNIHDFKSCSCQNIFIDGGEDYLRYGGKGMDDNSFRVIEKINVTLEFLDNEIFLPIQSEVENIDIILNDGDGREIYHKPVRVNDSIDIVRDVKMQSWKLKMK